MTGSDLTWRLVIGMAVPGRGYYSFELGLWHVVSLNSEGDTSASGRQAAWLRADLPLAVPVCRRRQLHGRGLGNVPLSRA